MWYVIDFYLLALQMLPTMLRKPAMTALSTVLLKPLNTLHYGWRQWRERNIYQLQHNGQVCYLRKALNDAFDPTERRIYIGDGLMHETLYIFTEGEAQDVFTGTEAEAGVQYLRTEAETADTGLDFIVWVPATVYNISIDGLRATVEFYKAGGKRYDIFIIDE